MKQNYKQLLLALCLLGQALAFSQISVKQNHPRILLDSSVILKLQARKTANTVEWQQVVTRINGVAGNTAQYIMSTIYAGEQYAYMYALSFYASGNTAHRDSAVSIFKEYFYNYTSDSTMYYDSGYESRSTMVDMAMLYDWLYAYITPAFRAAVRSRLVKWGNWINSNPGVYGYWTGPYYYEGNNYTMGHFVGLTALGFAIQSEDNVNGNKFISKVDSIRPFLISHANTRLNNGDANEGWGYGAGYAINFFKGLAIFKTATTNAVDHFVATTYDEHAAKFLPYASLPNLTHMLPEGDWARESTGELWEYHRLVADLISTYSNDAMTQKTAAFWASEAVPLSNFAVTAYRWFPFLYANKEITPVDYRTQPAFQANYIYTDTIGTDQFIRRTGWGSTDQWVSYRAGGRYGDHAHNGSGHFSIYDNGWLLIDKNIYAPSGIEGADSMHNCIHYQKMNNFDMYPYKDPIEHSAGLRRDLNQEISYLWTSSTPIYKARSAVYNCVDKNERQFLYIPGIKKVAVFDITKTTNSNKKWFGLNFNGPPTLSSDSSYSFYSNGQRTVYAHTCYPLNKTALEYGRSLRIGDKTLQQKDYFMHLVSVTPNNAPAPTVIPVNKDNGRVILSDFYGSYHQESGMDICILFAGDDAAFSHDSLIYEVPASSNSLRSYIAGLKIASPYFVSFSTPSANVLRVKVSVQNQAAAVLYTSSSGGILAFNVPDYVGFGEQLKESAAYHIFYNKLNEEINIETLDGKGELGTITLYDALGRVVTSEEVKMSSQAYLPTGQLAKGVYIISVKSGVNTVNKKVIVY